MWQWRRRLEWAADASEAGNIPLAINAERGRVASSAIGFNVGAGV
jgi:hypothetical protein